MFSLADSNFYYLSFFMNTGPDQQTADISFSNNRTPHEKTTT